MNHSLELGRNAVVCSADSLFSTAQCGPIDRIVLDRVGDPRLGKYIAELGDRGFPFVPAQGAVADGQDIQGTLNRCRAHR